MTAKVTYHHGDLRTALVHSALALLEEEGAAALSMRAVARHAQRRPFHITISPDGTSAARRRLRAIAVATQ